MNSVGGDFFRFIVYLFSQTPLFIVAIVGLILAIKNWANYPKACMFATIGFTLMMLQMITFLLINTMMPRLIAENGLSSSSIMTYYSVLGFVRALVEAAAWGFIVAAIFAQRYHKQ